MSPRPTTISQVSAALHAADNMFVLPTFPLHTPSAMSHPANVEHFGCAYMQLAASLALEIMVKAAREAAYHTGVKADDMIETIEADCRHMLEMCEAEFRWKADSMREEG